MTDSHAGLHEKKLVSSSQVKNERKCNNLGDSRSEFAFQAVASLQCTTRYLNGPQFILNGKADVLIEENVTVPVYDTKNGIGGRLQMASSSKIVISSEAMIIGRGRGMGAAIDVPISTCLNVGALHQVHREAKEQKGVKYILVPMFSAVMVLIQAHSISVFACDSSRSRGKRWWSGVRDFKRRSDQ